MRTPAPFLAPAPPPEQLGLLGGEDPDALVRLARRRWGPIATYCLFSGGDDSTVLAHRCARQYETLVFIDTGIAIPGVETFVREYAAWLGKELVVKRSGDAYRTLVLGDERWWSRYRAEGAGLDLEGFRACDASTTGSPKARFARAVTSSATTPGVSPGSAGTARPTPASRSAASKS